MLRFQVGTVVYFAPYHKADIGVLDTTTDIFATVALTFTGSAKYFDAAAISTKVYFAPCQATNVGILDTATTSFTTIALIGYTLAVCLLLMSCLVS